MSLQQIGHQLDIINLVVKKKREEMKYSNSQLATVFLDNEISRVMRGLNKGSSISVVNETMQNMGRSY